jgi:hypothetical protein
MFDENKMSLLSKLFERGGKKKEVWETTPGGPYEVIVTEDILTCTHPKRPTESIRWDQVQEITLVTTSEGPLLPDVWYLFVGDGTGCSVPSEAKGFDQLWDVFKNRFPTIDYTAMTAAGTDDARKVIWNKGSNKPVQPTSLRSAADR